MPDEELMQMPADKAYHLQRTEVLEECKIELVGWAKWRLSFFAALVAVGGAIGLYGGLSSIVKGMVDEDVQPHIVDAQKAIMAAQMELDRAQVSAAEAEKVASNMTKQAKELERRLNELQDEAGQLAGHLTGTNAKLKAELEGRLVELESDLVFVREELKRLGTTIPTIVDDKRAAARYTRTLDTALSAEKTKRERRKKNSEYLVILHPLYRRGAVAAKLTELEGKLREMGFRASVMGEKERASVVRMQHSIMEQRPPMPVERSFYTAILDRMATSRKNRMEYTDAAKDKIAEIEKLLEGFGIEIDESKPTKRPAMDTGSTRQIDVYIVNW